jgi:DNA-binding LacI/PurR family transcriptional regulator
MSNRSKKSLRRITLKDVADSLGVSTAAVSYAYSRPTRLSAELRIRVLEAARKLGYPGPDPVARNLRRGQTGVVGIVFPDPLPKGFTFVSTVLFLQGVAGVIEDGNFCLLLIPGTLRKVSNLKSVNAAAVDGLIVYSIDDRDPLVGAVLARRVPTVLVDSEAIKQVPTIGIDNEKAAEAAAEYLLKLGHRRFGIIAAGPRVGAASGMMRIGALRSATSADFRARLRGYAKALRKAGIPWEECVSIYNCDEHSQSEGRIAARTLLGLNPRPTAILAINDQLALYAMTGIQEMGFSVPNDVSIVGFDDIPDAALAKPPLTTVHQPLVDKGFWAAQILLALIRQEEPPDPGVLPTRLVIRASTAAAPGIPLAALTSNRPAILTE